MESKYGEVYPERAVAPLRDIVRQLLKDDGTVKIEEVEAAFNKLFELGFPPDEPLFLLRGQDELAPDTVRFYADLVEARDADLDIDLLIESANRMQRWEPRKLPD